MAGAAGAVGILGALRILVDADTAKAERALKAFGGKAQLAGTAIGAGVGLGVNAMLNMGNEWDAIGDNIRAKTGLVGDQFKQMEATVRDVGGNVSEDLSIVGDVVSMVQQRTGQMGPELAKAGESIIDLARLTNTEYTKAADNVATIYQAWNVAATEQVAVNDLFLRAYQKTGTTLDTLTTGLAKNGATFRQLGFSIEDSTVLLAALDKAGIESSTAMGSMRRAVSNLIKAGKDPQEAITGIFDAIKAAPTEVAAGQLAMETFGTKGAVMAQLIREGKLDVRALYDEIASGTDTVQQASDDTRDLSEGFKELKNRVVAALGPVTETFAGINEVFGNSAILLPALGGAIGKGVVKLFQSGPVRAAASKAGALVGRLVSMAIGPAMAVGNTLVNAITSSPAWEKAGKLAGGKFGMAFKLAAVAGIGLLIADQLAQLGEVRQANLEQANSINSGMDSFLAGMPSRAEVEAKLAGLRAVPEQLDGLQEHVLNFGKLGQGNILGSALDGLFGSNPAAVLDDQIKDLEGYLARLPADLAASVPASSAPLTNAVVKPIRTAFHAASREAARGFGSVWDALKNPPKLIPLDKRIQNNVGNLKRVMANLRKAVKAGDPINVQYWDTARAKVQARLDSLRGKTASSLGDIRRSYRKAGISVKGTWAEIEGVTKRKSESAQTTAVDAAQDTKAGIDNVDLYSSGLQMGNELAAGLNASVPNVAAAGNNVANAAAGPLEAHSPPRMGPLSRIDEWGGRLMDTWLGPIERSAGRARAASMSIASALAPSDVRGRMAMAGAGAAHGGSRDTFNVGVLVADERGLDELDRRTRRRKRMKARQFADPTRY